MVSAADGAVEIFNENFFTDLNNVILVYSVKANGKKVFGGAMPLSAYNIQPQQRQSVIIADVAKALVVHSSKEVVCTFEYKLAADTQLQKAGETVANEEFVLSSYAYPDMKELTAQQDSKDSPASVRFDDRQVYAVASAAGMSVTFDKQTGYVAYIDVDGIQITQDDSQLVPDFWRAPTDNDYGASLQDKLSAWQHPGLSLKSFDIRQDGTNVVAKAEYKFRSIDATLRLDYVMTPGGNLVVTQSMNVNPSAKNKPQPLRFGMNLQVKKPFSQIEYYGKGPRENYVDRQNSESLAIWRQTVEEQYYPYIRPQESGTKSQVRWWNITNAEGKGLRFAGIQPLECQTLEYTVQDLQPTREKRQFHSGDLVARPFNDVHISARSMGIGCVNSWGAWPRPEYQMPWQDYSYTFIISPVK